LERNPLILLFSEKLVSFEDLICFEKKALVRISRRGADKI